MRGGREPFRGALSLWQGKRATQLLVKALLAVRRKLIFWVAALRATASKGLTNSCPPNLRTEVLPVINLFWGIPGERPFGTSKQPREPSHREPYASAGQEPPQIRTPPRTPDPPSQVPPAWRRDRDQGEHRDMDPDYKPDSDRGESVSLPNTRFIQNRRPSEMAERVVRVGQSTGSAGSPPRSCGH